MDHYIHYESPRRRREKEGLFEEIIAENTLNLRKNMDIYIQEAPQTPTRVNLKRTLNSQNNHKRTKLEVSYFLTSKHIMKLQ